VFTVNLDLPDLGGCPSHGQIDERRAGSVLRVLDGRQVANQVAERERAHAIGPLQALRRDA